MLLTVLLKFRIVCAAVHFSYSGHIIVCSYVTFLVLVKKLVFLKEKTMYSTHKINLSSWSKKCRMILGAKLAPISYLD
jgi:hypothetical protein